MVCCSRARATRSMDTAIPESMPCPCATRGGVPRCSHSTSAVSERGLTVGSTMATASSITGSSTTGAMTGAASALGISALGSGAMSSVGGTMASRDSSRSVSSIWASRAVRVASNLKAVLDWVAAQPTRDSATSMAGRSRTAVLAAVGKMCFTAGSKTREDSRHGGLEGRQ